MSQGAKVTSLDGLKQLREALVKFKEELADALCSADVEIRRTFDWIEDELKWWHKEQHRREDLVGQARVALNRKKMERIFGREPDTTVEEKDLRKARHRLEHAEETIGKLRRWRPMLQGAVTEYEGPARQLGGMVDVSLPKSLVWLDGRVNALEEYLRLSAPSTPTLGPAGGMASAAVTAETVAPPAATVAQPRDQVTKGSE